MTRKNNQRFTSFRPFVLPSSFVIRGFLLSRRSASHRICRSRGGCSLLRECEPNCSRVDRSSGQDFQQSGLFHVCASAFIKRMCSIVHVTRLFHAGTHSIAPSFVYS